MFAGGVSVERAGVRVGGALPGEGAEPTPVPVTVGTEPAFGRWGETA